MFDTKCEIQRVFGGHTATHTASGKGKQQLSGVYNLLSKNKDGDDWPLLFANRRNNADV
jgi:hypothetical protein